MIKSKFFEIVKTFSREELKEFNDFVRSPFHNSNKKVIKLYEIIRKAHPELKSDTLRKEKIFQKLYPGKKYNDTVMRILSSDLLKLGEEYLILKRSRKDPSGEMLELLQELMDRGLDSLYQKNYKYAREILEKTEDRRSMYFSNFELEVVNVDFHLRKDKQQLIAGNVVERAEKLIYFMLIEIVRNVHDMIMNERTYNAKFDFNLAYEFMNNFNFEKVVNKIKLNRPEHYPLIIIYYNLLRAMNEEENESLYDLYKQSVEIHYDKLSYHELYQFLHQLESCCLNRMKYNTIKYRKEVFDVHELMLKYKTYSSSGSNEMTIQRFKNIVIGAVNLGELDWAEKFVNDYSSFLQPQYRESMINYSQALISFGRKDYQQSLEKLTKVRNDYFILKLDIKSWLMKIYFELNYYDSAYSLLDSFRHFLTSNRSLSDHFRERNQNFLKFTSELLKFKNGGGKMDASDLMHDIKNSANIVHRDWLMEKVSEL